MTLTIPTTISSMTMTNKYIVVDLDGTLCNSHWRTDAALAKDWDAFNAGIPHDQPFDDLVAIMDAMRMTHKVVLCTARNISAMDLTIAWLDKHCINYDFLLMRGNTDQRSDSSVKEELLIQWMDESEVKQEDITVIFEDRQHVVDMWREQGFTCYQVRRSPY